MGKRIRIKTITRELLERLARTNSKRLPWAVNDNGVRKEWVGIGWVTMGEPKGNEIIVEDENETRSVRFEKSVG